MAILAFLPSLPFLSSLIVHNIVHIVRSSYPVFVYSVHFLFPVCADDEGETALYQASAAGSTECVHLLLLAGASASLGNEVNID
jgi:ankyrin repeat protein